MSDLNNSGLITSKIQPREETYFLVTNDMLSNLNLRNIFSDISVFLASILWGGYISVIITDSTVTPSMVSPIPEAFKIFILVFAIVFTVLMIFIQILKWVIIGSIKKTNIKLNKTEDNKTAPNGAVK
jgi:amino acid permease